MLTSARRPSALAAREKCEINIIFDHNSEFLPCFATHDQIRGHVELKFDKDTVVEDLTISLEGQSMTYIEQKDSTAPTTARTTSKHNFLRLSQPISADGLPEEGVAKAGISYTVPFTFVVPERLLPYSCSHRVESDEIKQMHVELPPSLGDQSCTFEGHPFVDDNAPDMAKITYSICAKVSRSVSSDQTQNWVEKREPIRVVPARSEEPPMNVDSNSVDYTLWKDMIVKKGLFKFGKLGKLAAETSQPRSLHLSHPCSTSNEPVTTMITISLRFDPVNIDDQPPQLGSVVSKLKIYTFFGTAPFPRIVEPHQFDLWSAKQGMCLKSLELSSQRLSTFPWTRQDPCSRPSPSVDKSRRPSSQSPSTTVSIPEASENNKEGPPFYKAIVLLPISLPIITSSGRRNTFPPTFHSCLISRIYAVELDLSYHTPGSNVGASHIVLQLPVQVSTEGGTPPGTEIGSEEAIAAEIERQFRLGERPSDRFEQASPVYEELPSPRPRYASIDSGAPPDYHANAGGLGASGPRTQSDFSLTSTRRRTITGKSLAKLAIFAVSGIDVQR